MSQIIRSNNLEPISLSETDLESRTVLAVGWLSRELLPPITRRRCCYRRFWIIMRTDA